MINARVINARCVCNSMPTLSARDSSGGAPLAARGESLMAKKMCEMFDNVQGGLQVTSTFDSEGIVEALAVSVEPGKTTSTDVALQESGDTASGLVSRL